MKYSQFAGFEKHLLAASPQNFSPLYILLAKDENERRLSLGKMRQLLERQLAVQWQVFQAKDSSEDEIFNELETLPFLHPCKIVHIDDIQHFKKSTLDRLEQFIERQTAGLYLILSGSELKAQSFYKKAEKLGIILSIADEKPWEKEKNLQDWLIKEAAGLGKSMQPQAASLFIKALGSDVLLLNGEFNKLCCYVGERQEISLEDIKAAVSVTHQENNWQLGDALFKRNAFLAFKIIRGILIQEVPFFVLLRQLRAQFQAALQILSGTDEFSHLKEAAIERYRSQAREYGPANLPEALRTIDQIEWMAKNGEDRYDFLADFLILKLTTL